MKYRILCRQKAGFSSWDEPYTREEIIDKFREYAYMDDWEEMPPKRKFTMRFISDMWDVDFEKVENHGQFVCPRYNNASALPDEKDNCSLCGAVMVAGYPEQEGDD